MKYKKKIKEKQVLKKEVLKNYMKVKKTDEVRERQRQ